VEGLRVAEQAHCDTGSASTAGRAVRGLDSAPGSDAGMVPDSHRVTLNPSPQGP
jgi:hypothetical protein